MSKIEINNEITFVVFDGRYFAVGESIDPDKSLETIQKYNPDAEILAEGYRNVTRFETDLMFTSSLIGRCNELSWYLLDAEEGNTLINIVADEDAFKQIIS